MNNDECYNYLDVLTYINNTITSYPKRSGENGSIDYEEEEISDYGSETMENSDSGSESEKDTSSRRSSCESQSYEYYST